MPSTLHRLGLSATCALLLTSLCAAQPPQAGDPVPPGPPQRPTVFLDGPAAVERLKTEDPDHYAQVKAIMAEADVICAKGPAVVHYAQSQGQPHCETMFLKTSNPPKRQISFTLDGTQYVALVVITRDTPTLTPALSTPR